MTFNSPNSSPQPKEEIEESFINESAKEEVKESVV